MAVNCYTTFSWSIFDYETESTCFPADEYYLDQLFFGVESYDLSAIKSISNEHLRHLCRIRRFFDSEWAAPAKEQQTAYQRACLLGYTDIVQYMLEAGVRVDQLFSSANTLNVERGAFMFACHSGSLATVRLLLQALSRDYIEHYKSRNRRALCSTSFARQHLIPARSEIEAPFSDENGLVAVFPIHFAIARNDLELTRQLVTGANGELETINDWEPLRHGGFTPLQIACLFNRSLDMIKLLLFFSRVTVNPILLTSNQGTFADQMTKVREVIEYIRPDRVAILNAQEQERLKDLEEMQSGRPYQITIKPLSGQSLTLTVNGNTTAEEVGAQIESQWNLPSDRQRLLFSGRSVYTAAYSGFDTSLTLTHYNIKKDSILHIIWRNPI
ncbi:unnamed protein product [Adineta steineri]|uniref:Ubiquitin-like domain-containing protein n=2 Tax=Adineta steineri TaxID=433720 RepID=A0A818QNG8_9BILA|nr:unnamed protein product [Adineta steineri]CAF3643964.1 unnamed protein product [Adineta steineri]